MKVLPVLALTYAVVSAANCTSAGLSSMLTYFKNVPLSRNCLSAGPWNSTTMPIDFLTSLRDYVPLACSQSACRDDFELAASNFQNIFCDEAQAIGFAFNGIRKMCLVFNVVSDSSTRCSNADSFDLGAITSQCYGLIPNITSLTDYVLPSDLSLFSRSCSDSCVLSMLNGISKLSDCVADSPFYGGAPMSTKAIFQTYVNAMCGKTICNYHGGTTLCDWYQPNYDYTSCSAQLTRLYTTPFSSSCRNAVFNGSMAYIIQSTTQGNYLLQSHRLGMEPSCRSDVAALHSQCNNPCTISLANGLQIMQTVWQNNSSMTYLSICDDSMTALINASLALPPSTSCTNLGVNVSNWLDVLFPARSSDLLKIVSSSACVSAALNFTKTLPPCEWLDATGLPMSVNATSRFSSFLVAAMSTLASPPAMPVSISPTSCNQPGTRTQAIFSYYQNQTLSTACQKFGPWNTSTRPIDFLSSLQSYIPLACSQRACRSDFETSANNLGSLTCDESYSLSRGMYRIVDVCQSLQIATSSRMCSNSDTFNLGSLPAECASDFPASVKPSMLEIIFPPNLTALNSSGSTSCIMALLNRAISLPECQVEWPYLASAPMSPRMLYKTFLNVLYKYDICTQVIGYSYYPYYTLSPYLCSWSSPPPDFSSCSAVMASLYSTPFSSTCSQAYMDRFGNQTSTTAGKYIIETALTGNYLVKSRFLAERSYCTQDVVTLAARSNCSSPVNTAFKILQKVWNTSYTKIPGLTKCDQNLLSNLLNASLPSACSSANLTMWSQIFLPSNLTTLLLISQNCVNASLTYVNSWPACEWVDDSSGESMVGMNIATRVSSFLVAAQTLPGSTRYPFTAPPAPTPSSYYYPTPSSSYSPPQPTSLYFPVSTANWPTADPWSSSCNSYYSDFKDPTLSYDCQASLTPNLSGKVSDLLKLRDAIPLACFKPSCRADIKNAISYTRQFTCYQAVDMANALTALNLTCQRLQLSFNRPTCNNLPMIGALPDECSGSIYYIADYLESYEVMAYKSNCKNPTCVDKITTSILGLSDCQINWPAAGGAPISPKTLYLSYFTGMCNLTSSLVTSVDFRSCSANLSSLYTATFSYNCNVNLSTSTAYILQTAFQGDYLHKSQNIALNTYCKEDLSIMKDLLTAVGSCAADLVYASNVLEKVMNTSYTINLTLSVCTESQISTLSALLAGEASALCFVNSYSVTWNDVLLPNRISDIAPFANNTNCVDAAVAFAKTLPSCEWAELSKGHILTGVDAATRVTSFLLAAQSSTQAANTTTSSTWHYTLATSLLIAEVIFFFTLLA